MVEMYAARVAATSTSAPRPRLPRLRRAAHGVRRVRGTRRPDRHQDAREPQGRLRRRVAGEPPLHAVEAHRRARGRPQSALAAFDRAAAEETAHALGHLAYMGGFGTTADNLAAAAEGEGYENAEMYPAFAEKAEAEGFPRSRTYFRRVGRFEGEHKGEYEKALEELDQ